MFFYPVAANDVTVSSANLHPTSCWVSTGISIQRLTKEAKCIPITIGNKSDFFILPFSFEKKFRQ